jgi:AAA family ATP:ADP antiporter
MPRALRRIGLALQRALGAELRDGEWRLAFVFFVNLFFLLTAYYILKVIREPLILLDGGAVERSYAHGLQAGLLLLLIPIYGALANRYEPARLVKWIMLVFVTCVVAFVVLARLGFALGFAFFVWLGIFSTLAIAQFWSLANDVMTEAEGQRLFPLVAAGGTLGGIFGAQLAARLIGDLSPQHLMLVAAAVLVACAFLTHFTHQVGLAHRARVKREVREARDARGAFTLILSDRYLLFVALSVVILNFVNTNGDFALSQLVSERASALPASERRAFVASFYGNYQTYISVVTALIQLALVSRLFRRLGVSGALMIAPIVGLLSYGSAALLPVLALLATVKILENGAQYSLQNTVQQALFLPTSRDAKYKAKAAIDTLFVRLGDLASTALVFFGVQAGMSVLGYVVGNVLICGVWLWVAWRLRRLVLNAPPEACVSRQAA